MRKRTKLGIITAVGVSALLLFGEIEAFASQVKPTEQALTDDSINSASTEKSCPVVPDVGVVPEASQQALPATGGEAPASTPPATSATPVSVGDSTTYSAIQAAAPDEYHFETPNEYLAEFLRQNPSVRWWQQDHTAQTITALGEPKVTGMTVSITPTGGNDTAMIARAAAQAGPGGAVIGNGQPFKVSLLVAERGVTYKDMPMVPAVASASQIVKVTTPDVSFINSPIDLLGREINHGFYVYDNGDRFTLVNGGVSNQINRTGGSSAMIRIRNGADDVYIVGNTFENGFASNQGTHIRGIKYGRPNPDLAPSGGIIASNHFENLQSSETGSDADAFVTGGFGRDNQFSERLLFAANVGVDAGKRLIKAQSGGIDAHSNSNWWKTADGPEGRRVTRAHYDSQAVSNVRWTNNYARTDFTNPDSESFFMQAGTRRWEAEYDTTNIVFKNNVYEHNDSAAGRVPYVFRIRDDGNSGAAWPTNSEFTNNHIRGTGSVKFLFWFFGPGDSSGNGFDHSANSISLKSTNGDYRK